MFGLRRKRAGAVAAGGPDGTATASGRDVPAEASPARGIDAIPPQSEVEGGPETPLEPGGSGWRDVLRRR